MSAISHMNFWAGFSVLSGRDSCFPPLLPCCDLYLRGTFLREDAVIMSISFLESAGNGASAGTESTVKVKGSSNNETAQRVTQWLGGVLWVQILTCFGAVGVMLLALATGSEPGPIQETNPTLLAAAFYVVPLVSVFLGVLVSVRGVYLAQLVGAGIGLAGVLLIFAERMYFGLPPAWHDWIVMPVLGAAVGFGAGLRVCGRLIVQDDFEYKPIDAWDRTAKPRVRELNPRLGVRWKRLLFGYAVGISAGYLMPTILELFLRPLYRFNEANVQSMMTMMDIPLAVLAIFMAGVAAGSSTKSGLSQGLLVGAFIFAVRYLTGYITGAEEVLTQLAICLLPAMLGGIAGRKIFRPTQIYHSPGEMTL